VHSTPPSARLLATALFAAVLLAGCGGGSSGSKSSQSGGAGPGASQLASAETPQFCQGLGVNGCRGINTEVESWLANAHLKPTYAVGALDFAVSGCLNCHMYQKSGVASKKSKAPDLTHVGGSRNQAQIVAELRCPTCVHPGSQMPAYRSLSTQTVNQLAAFLAASR